jgi:1,4-alpha-glucan branching enzyme
MIGDYDIFLFHEGTHIESYKFLGAHLLEVEGQKGVAFTLWAPNARSVKVVGDFNNWDGKNHSMEKVKDSGFWYLFIPNLTEGTQYKYKIDTFQGKELLKTDPYGFYSELRPNTASVVYDLNNYRWDDGEWIKSKKSWKPYDKPINIYEVHLGSWKRNPDGTFINYRDMAEILLEYVVYMGYSHIELMPIAEHPFDGSWGYQTTGYYSATSRYGTPDDLRYFIDRSHQRGIGIILDWVPGHFCKDAHGLWNFDGTSLYQYNDIKKAENYGWGTSHFDLGRGGVQSFLISNALFWLKEFHFDGIRVDAVASMLYLDYGKKEDEWSPNIHGGKENLEAVDFLKRLNKMIFKHVPNTLVIAEESTEWPKVTKPIHEGGLGFNYKWNMGWMNDILNYMELDPLFRKGSHNKLTFSLMYAFSENFMLPLSHDEVVHGKKSLLNKMPGDYWQKFSNLRLLYTYMMTHPGKKTLFMGGEFGQFIEWNHDRGLDWNLLEYESHSKLKAFVKELNHLYKSNEALWFHDHGWEGFEWISSNDWERSIIAFIRKGKTPKDFIIVILNFTPEVYRNYHIGVPQKGKYIELFNSDDLKFGGSGQLNEKPLMTEKIPCHGREFSIVINIPPLGGSILNLENDKI